MTLYYVGSDVRKLATQAVVVVGTRRFCFAKWKIDLEVRWLVSLVEMTLYRSVVAKRKGDMVDVLLTEAEMVEVADGKSWLCHESHLASVTFVTSRELQTSLVSSVRRSEV